VVVDRTGPFVSLQTPHRTESGWEITGSVSDEAPATLDVDGRPAALSRDGNFHVTLPSRAHTAYLHAADAAGNETRQEVTLGDGESRASGWKVGALPTDTKVAVADAGSIKLLRQPPDVVSSHYVALNLEVVAPAGIARLSVAGEPILGLPDRPRLSFSQLVELHNGKNDLDIVLTDKDGREVRRMVSVERRNPDQLLAAERLQLAYYELSPAGTDAAETALAHRFNSIFEYQLSETTRFSVLERNRLDALMLERELSVSKLADPRYAVKLDTMKIADLLLLGQVRARPDGVAAEARLVQTRTGRIAAAMDVFHEKTDTATLEMLARALAGEMESRFPVVRGKIVALPEGGRRFVMDRGSNAGLRADLPVVVFSEKNFDVTLCGRGWIEAVKPERAAGRLDADSETPLAVGLEVVTR